MDNQLVNLRKNFSKNEDDFIRSHYILNDNNSVRKIANELKCSETQIRKRIGRLKLDLSKRIRYKDSVMIDKEPNVYNAYVLGAYLTDGSISGDCFDISSKDKDYLEHIVFCLEKILDNNFNKNIRMRLMDDLNETKIGAKYSCDNYRIRIRSSDLCAWLIAMTESKQTISDDFLSSSDEIKKSLLAGLLDGDGFCSIDKRMDRYTRCMSGYKIGLCGNRYIYGSVAKYATLLDKLGLRYKESISKNESPGFLSYIINAYDFVDKECYFVIKRKQSRIEMLKNVRKNFNEYHGTSIKLDEGVL